MAAEYWDCVWYRKPQRAAGRALQLSRESAEPMFVVEDKKSRMFGVGVGDETPTWCREEEGLEMVCVIRPTEH